MSDFEIKDGILYSYKGDEETVEIPEGVTEIGEGAFRGSHLLKEVIISEGVKIIGESAFEYCSQLESV